MLKIMKFGVKIELIQLYPSVILLDYVINNHPNPQNIHPIGTKYQS